MAKMIYYLSDQGANHKLNIWSYDTAVGRRKQVTDFDDYDVKWPSIGPGPDGNGRDRVPEGTGLFISRPRHFEGARGHRADPRRAKPHCATTLSTFTPFMSNWSISPSGKRAAVEARGDIWTVPAKDGVPRNLTANERRRGARSGLESRWARWVGYFSDATGEYELLHQAVGWEGRDEAN